MSGGKILYDTSFYIEVLRSKSFAQAFRSRYEADIPITFFSSVVIQELLAGATDRLKRAVVEGLYRGKGVKSALGSLGRGLDLDFCARRKGESLSQRTTSVHLRPRSCSSEVVFVARDRVRPRPREHEK